MPQWTASTSGAARATSGITGKEPHREERVERDFGQRPARDVRDLSSIHAVKRREEEVVAGHETSRLADLARTLASAE